MFQGILQLASEMEEAARGPTSVFVLSLLVTGALTIYEHGWLLARICIYIYIYVAT